MRVTKTCLLALVLMIILSIFAANLANILSTDPAYERAAAGDGIRSNGWSGSGHLQIGDSYQHLIWFLQISDIHISVFRDPSRITQFKEFCDVTLDTIQPRVVLASGDLTDAKTGDSIGSKQNEEEWRTYRNILAECQVTKKTAWLDIRGNHDNFNVIGPESKENFFPNYSIQGHRHPRSYMHQVQLTGEGGGELYSFIGIDACLEPGPRRPFNFVGMLDETEVDELNRLIARTRASGSNYTVWFGHFPTSCILTTDSRVTGGARSIIRQLDQSYVYVCGHLHTLGGLVPNMYTLQRDGFLELELGDWKDNRRYRLMAIDHGYMSFVDVNHNEWPVALITNPKHALFMIPGKEPVETLKDSTHIRVLAFSINPVEFVKVRIDDSSWQSCEPVKGPLYVCSWTPTNYETGMHIIEVFVRDELGREKISSQPFSLDGSRLSFGLLSKIALMSNASSIFKFMFGLMLVCSLLPIVMLKILHSLVKAGKIRRPRMREGRIKGFIRKLWILSTVDRIFWPLVIYTIYLSVGPWSVGHIIEDHIGVIFAWGIFVNGTFLPGSLTYAYGFLQILTFQIPLTLILATGVYRRYGIVVKTDKSELSLCSKFCLHLPFVILLTIQIMLAYFFWLAYGGLAFILGPLRTWSIILALLLWIQALNIPEKCTRDAAYIWHVSITPVTSQPDISLTEPE